MSKHTCKACEESGRRMKTEAFWSAEGEGDEGHFSETFCYFCFCDLKDTGAIEWATALTEEARSIEVKAEGWRNI